jgi:hypothetical protein
MTLYMLSNKSIRPDFFGFAETKNWKKERNNYSYKWKETIVWSKVICTVVSNLLHLSALSQIVMLYVNLFGFQNR